jgi:dephospho-CoA kinase
MLREQGLAVLEADAIARAMMQPGERVYGAIVEHFGAGVVQADGTLDRARLAELSFGEGRLEELTRLVHPPVIAEQERRMAEMFAADPSAVVVVESALVFEAAAGGEGMPGSWRDRFDRVILVTAPEELKVARYVSRVVPEGATGAMRADAERGARARLAAQIPDAAKRARSNYIIDNSGSLAALRRQVEPIAAELRSAGCR